MSHKAKWVLGVAFFTIAIFSTSTSAQTDSDLAGPGPEHAGLIALTGDWRLYAQGQPNGVATARSRLGGRFVEFELLADAGPIRQAVYTFGYDRRHDRYNVSAMDNTGTYWVVGQGHNVGGRIAMYGKDDDPNMEAMGLKKEFAIVLEVKSENEVSIEVIFIDTRTPERNEIQFLAFDLRR